jgi:hypothetical protein
VLYQNGEFIALPFPASNMNDKGQVVGVAGSEADGFTGILWDNGTIHEMPEKFQPHAINNRGEAIGYGRQGDVRLPAIFSNGKLMPLECEGREISGVHDINDAGEILAVAEEDDPIFGARAGIWHNGSFTDIEMPYDGSIVDGLINEKGQIAGQYWIDVGPPYVYEESTYFWSNGVAVDLSASTSGHFGFSGVNDLDDEGRIVAWSDGKCFLLDPKVSASKSDPFPRPDAEIAFALYRDPAKVLSLGWLGMPGAAKVERFFASLLGKGRMTKAVDPARVRAAANRSQPVLIVDANGVTVPTLGFLPWAWVEMVMAFDIEGKAALTVGWRFVPEVHNRFPQMKARAMLYEDGVLGGRMVKGELEAMPLMELYKAIEAFCGQHVLKEE